MSFENAFEKWLGGHTVQAEEEGEEGSYPLVSSDEDAEGEDGGVEEAEKMESDLSCGDDDGDEDDDDDDGGGMPVIERMAWQEEDLKGMPVLQRMVDLPSKNSMQAACSPPPPPLQISLSLKRCSQEGKHNKRNKSGSSRYRVKSKDEDGMGSKKTHSTFQDAFEFAYKSGKDSTSSSKIKDCLHLKRKHKKHSESTHYSNTGNFDSYKDGLKGIVSPAMTALASPGPGGDVANQMTAHQHDGSMSAVGDMMSVGDVDVSSVKRTAVLSPDRGHVEPDSTSEISGSDSRTNSQRTDSDVEMEKDGLSPLASGLASRARGCGSEVNVRVEEGMGECDSTSMFLASPSAISPASQGEIEERVCPVLTDHEEGSNHVSHWSPGHCICQFRSFPPPTDLISPTTTSTSTGSCNTKSSPSLVSANSHFCCEAAPQLEKMPMSLDQNLDPPELDEHHRESPPLLSLTVSDHAGDRKGEDRLGVHCYHQECDQDSEHHEAPPPLTRYEPGAKDHDGESLPSPGIKYSESPPVLSLPENSVDDDFTAHVKSDHLQDIPVFKEKVEDFSSDIQWESAVATVETKPSPNRGSDGEGKPGIVIKIRTKAVGKSLLTVPEVEPTVARNSRQPMRIRKKRHTIDSPEMVRSLRKRRRTGEDEKLRDAVKEKEVDEEIKHSEGCMARGRRPRSGQNATCLCCTHVSPKHKRRRRNTVQLGGDLTASVAHLSENEQQFVLSLSRLYRLQTRAHDLVCTLFPRLAPILANIAPESQRFEKVIEDIISSLQRSESEENHKDSEELSQLLRDLTLETNPWADTIPVFSPQVVLCNSPRHSLEEFQEKLCWMLQLLLPDLTVSLTDNLFHTSEELELMLDRVILANKFKAAKKL